MIQKNMPTLWQRLSWIWLICGLGLMLMGGTTSWDDKSFSQPKHEMLHSYSGELQQVTYSAPAKSPTLVEMVIYNKQEGSKRGYLRYGLHGWEERFKPYLHQSVTMFVGVHQQIWGVQVKGKMLLTKAEISHRLQTMKVAQQDVASKFLFVGFMMSLFWLFVIKRLVARQDDTKRTKNTSDLIR